MVPGSLVASLQPYRLRLALFHQIRSLLVRQPLACPTTFARCSLLFTTSWRFRSPCSVFNLAISAQRARSLNAINTWLAVLRGASVVPLGLRDIFQRSIIGFPTVHTEDYLVGPACCSQGCRFCAERRLLDACEFIQYWLIWGRGSFRGAASC